MFDNNNMNDFPNRLTELRTEKGVSRHQLAIELNVSDRIISYWEAGERECNFDMLIKIANFFEESIDDILIRKNY